MRNTLRQVFHSSKFIVGFAIFSVLLAVMLFYPLFNPGSPLQSIGLGTFAKPGTYVSLYDSVGTKPRVFRLPEADGNRVAQLLSMEDRVKMIHYMELAGADLTGLDINDTEALIENWHANFDASLRPQGMTKAERNYYSRLDTRHNEATGGRKLTAGCRSGAARPHPGPDRRESRGRAGALSVRASKAMVVRSGVGGDRPRRGLGGLCRLPEELIAWKPTATCTP